MTKILGGIMRHLIAPRGPRPLPTGPNPMTPLDQFIIEHGGTPCLVCHQFGQYLVTIDPAREVAEFTHNKGLYEGKLWLAGRVMLAAEHLMPREVQLGMIRVGYEVAR